MAKTLSPEIQTKLVFNRELTRVKHANLGYFKGSNSELNGQIFPIIQLSQDFIAIKIVTTLVKIVPNLNKLLMID